MVNNLPELLLGTLWIQHGTDSSVVECLPWEWEVAGSSLGCAISKA